MRVVVYRSGILRREWRWRMVAGNGRRIAHGGEGYRNRADCLSAVALVLAASPDTPVTVIT